MTQPSDASLVLRTLSGDAEAFGTLVRRYQRQVYGVALAVLARFDLALDAVQDALLCAYCKLDRLKEPARFGSWLCGIARNTAHELRREQLRHDAAARRMAGRTPEDAAPSAAELAMLAEQRRCVQDALGRINEKDREAMTTCYAEGLSHHQVCAFLGISAGTLKGRLQRGRAALRKELTMVEQACGNNAPDDAFARQLEAVVRVLGAKGPATHHIPSSWHQSIIAESRRVLSAGDEGLRIDIALSHAGSAWQRRWATVHLGLREDEGSLRELERMLEDRAPRVRASAVSWYAMRINPTRGVKRPMEPATATQTPPQLERVLAALGDASFNVRWRAVLALGAYVNLNDHRVVAALRRALGDTKHKVRHAAARLLRVACPGCGRKW